MRILIIAIARSGGYQLNEWLALELGYKMLHEPIWKKLSIDENNIVVKYNIGEIKEATDIDLTNWDKIIGLTRIDTYNTSISQVAALERKEYRLGYEVSNEWIEKNKTDIVHFQKWVEEKVCIVNGIKEIILRVTYEGIYNTKEDIQRIKDYIGITNTKYEHLLDNTNRLRDRGKTKRKLL